MRVGGRQSRQICMWRGFGGKERVRERGGRGGREGETEGRREGREKREAEEKVDGSKEGIEIDVASTSV